MIARNRMKIGGKWYKAGEEIPSAGTNPKDDFSQHMNAPEIEEESTEVKYTKTEINRMSNANLKQLAQEQDIDDIDSKTGAELKKLLIEKFGL